MKMLNSALLMLSASIILSVLTVGSFHTAFADFQLSKPYILDGGGFVIDDKTIENSFIEISFLPAEQIGSKIKMKINDGTIIFEGKEFLFKQYNADILREGRFLRVIGFAEDNQGEQISLRFFGKLLGKSTDEFVYELRGKLERSGEEFDLYYITRSGLEVAPQLIETQKIAEMPEAQRSTAEPEKEKISDTNIQLDVTHYLRVVQQSMFKFTVKAYIVSDEGIRQSRYSIPEVNMTVDVYDSLNKHIQHFEGLTNKWGFSEGFVVGHNIPLGTYKLNVTATYQGATDSKEMDFFVNARRDFDEPDLP